MNKRIRFSASLLLTASLLAACGGQSSKTQKSPTPATPKQASMAAAASAVAPVNAASAASAASSVQTGKKDVHHHYADKPYAHAHSHDHPSEKHKHDHAHWSYKGDDGAEHWGELSDEYEMCKIGKNQSPVNINESDAHMTASTGASSINRKHINVEYELINNGHTVQATPLKFGNALQVNGEEYILRQFHFHTPSEHTFKNQHYPLEMHFVYQNAMGQLAVLGVMVLQGAENPALVPFQQKLEPNKPVQYNQTLDIATLFPQNTAHFRLSGSLTTPPCSEGVNWILYSNPVYASEQQINALREMMGENNRPVQPLNSRLVVGESQ